MNERWPPPTDPIAFESLCADLWGAIWGQVAQKNGRNGQPQAGVDIYGRQGDKWIGVQCKQKDDLLRAKLTAAELAEEVEAARRFEPPLGRFVIATTGPADATIQEAARRLTEQHDREGLFAVEIWSWTEIWAELNRRPGLLRVVGPVYWPRLFSVATEQKSQDQTEQILKAIQSPLLPCGLFVTLRIEATDEDFERVYGGQAGFHELPAPPSRVEGRHLLGDRYIDVNNGAISAAGFFRLKHAGYNTLHREVKHTVARFNPARCQRTLSPNEPLFMAPQVTLDFYRDGRPRSADTRPTLVLESHFDCVGLMSSCALDNTVLVDYEYPSLTVSPADAAGFSITSLRGSYIRATLDFFYIRSIACLPEQSWPQLHNLQILLGSRRHALTFTLEDLSKQITRVNPSPLVRGDAVMPQIVFECEIEPESFDKRLVSVVRDQAHRSGPNPGPSPSVEFSTGSKLDLRRSGAKPSTKDVVPQAAPIVSVCKLCEQRSTVDVCSVVPLYLFPKNPGIPKEHLVCSACAEKIAAWDQYGERVMQAFPEDLSDLAGCGLRYEVDYGQLRLWLLSLLWRMSIAKGSEWIDVALPNGADGLRALLARGDPGKAGQYPVGCILPSFDGQHLDFSSQPDTVGQPNGPVVRAAFRGVLFFFCFREDMQDEDLDPFHIRPDQNWIVPVVDWKEIDFLRHCVEELRASHAARENT
jgi:hypothetical protein